MTGQIPETVEAVLARIDERTKHMHEDIKSTKQALAAHVRDDKDLEVRVRKNERFRAMAVAAFGVGGAGGSWSLWNLFS